MIPRLSRRDACRLVAAAPALALVGCAREEPRGSAFVVVPSTTRSRAVARVVEAQRSVDGAGVKLRRALGSTALSVLDPFLLLDEIHSNRPEDYLAGFPTHPHRGFETVTYVLEGAIEHNDSLGNHGRLGPGSIQWMTAGHGIVHSEMPGQKTGPLWGFQLWVNLPAAHKMTRPRYQDLGPEKVVEVDVDEARVRLVAGTVGNARGPVEGIVTAPLMLDVRFAAAGSSRHPVPASHNAFAYVIEGGLVIGPDRTRVEAGHLAVLGEGDEVILATAGPARALLLAGKPIGEPVVRHGPFVMNTAEEIRQAIEDYRTGRLVGG